MWFHFTCEINSVTSRDGSGFLLFGCSDSKPKADNIRNLLYCTPFLLRKLFIVTLFARAARIISLFFCARSASNFFTLLYPFLLRKLFVLFFFLRAQREETFLTLPYPFSLRKLLLYLVLLRKLVMYLFFVRKKPFWQYCTPCCLEKICVVNFGFQNPRNFQLKKNFPLGALKRKPQY